MAACQLAHRLGLGVSRRTAIGAALLGLAGSGAVALTGCAADQGVEKPVLYIYPETTMDLSVRLDYDGELTHLYPEASADGGRVEWEVTARPDGVLTDSSGRSYPYLFWEGRSRPALSQEAGAAHSDATHRFHAGGVGRIRTLTVYA